MISACILAGGLSARMGKDKAQLRLGGKTLLSHARSAAQGAGLTVRVVRRDLVPRCGPIGGIYTGLRRTKHTAVIFLSCDMPFVTAAIVKRLAIRISRHALVQSKHAQAGPLAVFSAREGTFGFPCAVLCEALPLIAAQMEKKDFSLQGLARALKAEPLPISARESASLLNVNTPEDYAAAKSRRQQRPAPRRSCRKPPTPRG